MGIYLLCFVGGLLCMSLVTPERVETKVVFVPAPIPPPVKVPKEQPPQKISPQRLELEAEQAVARADSARLFRKAGDLYLLDERNHRAALRCYRNFLDEADSIELQSDDADTWLLTSLKQARRQNP